MVRWPILLMAALAGANGPSRGGEPKVRFLDQVAPILVRKSQSCHDAKKALGGYRVDTYGQLMAESEAGRMVEPGKPDDSILFMLIESNEPTGRMPKNADPLPASEVATLRRWIEEGAGAGGIDPDAELAGLVARGRSASFRKDDGRGP